MSIHPQRFDIDQSLLIQSFNRAAETYDHYNFLQKHVGQKLIAQLDFIKLQPKHILEIGCGTGFCTTLLREKYPQAQIIALDIAENMLRKAKRTYGDGESSTQYICADATHLPFAPTSFDLIFSNLTLQWLSPYQWIFKEWLRVVRPSGCLLLSTFGPNTLHELRTSWHGVDVHTHTNQFIDILTTGNDLMHSGWHHPVLDHEDITVRYEQLDQLFKDLKMIGAHNMTLGRHNGLMGKDKWQRFLKNYADHYRHEGKYNLSYQVIYAHSFAPPIAPNTMHKINIPIDTTN